MLADGLQVTGPVEGILEIVVGTRPGLVEGTVVDERGDRTERAFVALTPETPGKNRTDIYRNTLPAEDGRFRFENIPPGDYRIFAWADVEQGAWQAPEFLEGYLALGERVHVEESGQVGVEVRVIPAGR